MNTLVDRVSVLFAPLDAVRSAVLRVIGRPGKNLLVRRDARVVTYACASATAMFTLATLFPTWVALLGPLVLGVPHLLSDVRYLIARPRLVSRGFGLALAAVPIAATWIWPRFWVGAAALVVLGFVLKGSRVRKAVVVVLGLVAIAVGKRYGYAIDLAFAHAHNLIALVIWWLWAPRRALHVLPLLLVFVGISLIASGAVDAWPYAFGGADSVSNVHLSRFAHVMSFSEGTELSMRWAMFFLFTQSVHYAVWLRLVPEDDRPREGLRPFASSFRALAADLGLPLIALAAAASAGLFVWALSDLDAARIGYLRGAVFHGYLELGALAVFFVEGRRFFAERVRT